MPRGQKKKIPHKNLLSTMRLIIIVVLGGVVAGLYDLSITDPKNTEAAELFNRLVRYYPSDVKKDGTLPVRYLCK